MDEPSSSSTPSASSRARGRGKSRGGLGKYLRARGRGGGRGRPAVWGQRLVLEGEAQGEEDAEAQQELERKYAKRQLGSNADRYAEPEPELDSDGEEVVEPEVDLSAFLERQKLSDEPATGKTQSKKGKVKQIEWDAELEKMSREKAAAEASRDLKTRFRAQNTRQRGKLNTRGVGLAKTRGKSVHRSPAQLRECASTPTDTPTPEKPEKEGMQDFLDDLLG
ncbi:hypothetical protein B0H21DRAFT_735226 [Amylocystis lapponica]|nr:hypothetical protein B0H21DRAFT_735226 [Amylocystis lapponica]